MKRLMTGMLFGSGMLAAHAAAPASSGDAHAALQLRYVQALQAAIMQNWIRPEHEPAVPCRVQIEQAPGGQVLDARVDADCAYDEAGRRSLIEAVRRAEPLPYRGYESVFRRKLSVVFTPR